MANGLDVVASFGITTSNPAFVENLSLVFAAPNNYELGAVYSPGGGLAGSGICQNVPGASGCEPDVALSGSTAVSSATIANLPGGSSSTPVLLLTAAPVAQVTGTISQGAQDYYVFQWAGGAFSASLSISGASGGASYVFSEGAFPGCTSTNSVALNSGNGFTGTIAVASLAPGQYCVGLVANDSNDPPFTLTFNTPVYAPTCNSSTASGAVDSADVQVLIDEALGFSPAVNDMNGDGVVNVADIQAELDAALSVGCQVGSAALGAVLDRDFPMKGTTPSRLHRSAR
jgi:hypothetical protein